MEFLEEQIMKYLPSCSMERNESQLHNFYQTHRAFLLAAAWLQLQVSDLILISFS